MNTAKSKYPHPAIMAVMIPVGIVCTLIGVGAAVLAALRLIGLAAAILSSL